MAISFTCPHCGKTTAVDERFAGQTGPCAACGQTVTVPMPGAPLAPAKSGGAGLVIGILGAALVGSLCVCGVLAGLLFPAISTARTAAQRSQSQNNLKMITIALHNYHDIHRTLPPPVVRDANGKPLYSWRVCILPFMEQAPLYERFDKSKAWDAPENLAISNMALEVFRSPGDPTVAPNGTNYFVLVGPNTLLGDGSAPVAFGDVPDGISNTIAFIEMKGVSGSWAAPIDPDISTMQMTIGNNPGQIQPVFPQGTNVGMGDASVHFLSSGVDAATLSAGFSRNGGEAVWLP